VDSILNVEKELRLERLVVLLSQHLVALWEAIPFSFAAIAWRDRKLRSVAAITIWFWATIYWFVLDTPTFEAFPVQEVLAFAFRLLALVASCGPTRLAAIDDPVTDNALLVLSLTVKHVRSPCLRSSWDTRAPR
jgi:hypothetical protein